MRWFAAALVFSLAIFLSGTSSAQEEECGEKGRLKESGEGKECEDREREELVAQCWNREAGYRGG